MTKRKNILITAIVIVVALGILYSQKYQCKQGEILNQCQGNSLIVKTCLNNTWQENKTLCETGKTCSYEACVDVRCDNKPQTKKTCTGDFTYVLQTCQDGVYFNKKELCESNYYCDRQMNECIAMPNKESYFRQIGSLSDWDKYYQNVSGDVQLKQLTLCTNEFDCGTKNIELITEEIKRNYDTSTPIKFIDAVSEYVNKYLYYNLNPPQQCGLTASQLVANKGPTNCVGYATLMVAILRHEKIPSRMVGGCVSVVQTPKCRPFAFYDIGMLRAGNIRADQINGHAWVEVYTPDKGWVIADPTVGKTVSECIGYSRGMIYGGTTEHPQQVCYLENYNQILECRSF